MVIARLTAAHAVGERKIADAVERAHTDSHQSELSRAARLADAIRNLDEARGLSEVLERLAHCAGMKSIAPRSCWSRAIASRDGGLPDSAPERRPRSRST